MGEKRKPSFAFLLKKTGKIVMKIELFPKTYWPKFDDPKEKWRSKQYYRIKLNGKWFGNGKYQFFSSYQIRDMLWRSIVKRNLFN